MAARIYLRRPQAGDQREFLAAVRRSAALHARWVEPPVTAAQFRAYLVRMEDPAVCGFFVFRRGTDAMVGVINLSNIVMGRWRSANVGYYAFAGFERQGLMREALKAVIRHAFGTLKLHRLEAGVQPGNAGSIALIRSCGFSKEGYSARFLKIYGRWRDHERWAIVAP